MFLSGAEEAHLAGLRIGEVELVGSESGYQRRKILIDESSRRAGRRSPQRQPATTTGKKFTPVGYR